MCEGKSGCWAKELKMRVVTYNIQWGMGRDGKIDLPRIAAAVRACDIICLQEVERNWRRGPDADQVEQLSALLPDHYFAFAPSVDVHDAASPDRGARRQYGVMTLSRWPIGSIRVFPLKKYPIIGHLVDQSCLQELIVNADGGAMRVYNTHLSYLSQRQRRLQVEEIMQIVADAPKQGGPVVGVGVPEADYYDDWMAVGPEDLPQMPLPAMIMGDFNMRPNAPEYDRLVGEKDAFYGRLHETSLFSDVLTLTGHAENHGMTHPEDDGSGFMRIDHILVTAELAGRVTKAWIDADADGSDHQPVYAEFGATTAGCDRLA
jgi:endonuclease/exonuclease/phosphatase family metal-dependent hydrolase